MSFSLFVGDLSLFLCEMCESSRYLIIVIIISIVFICSVSVLPVAGPGLTQKLVTVCELVKRGDWVSLTQSTLLPPTVTEQNCSLKLLNLIFIGGEWLDSLPQVIIIYPNSESL